MIRALIALVLLSARAAAFNGAVGDLSFHMYAKSLMWPQSVAGLYDSTLSVHTDDNPPDTTVWFDQGWGDDANGSPIGVTRCPGVGFFGGI